MRNRIVVASAILVFASALAQGQAVQPRRFSGRGISANLQFEPNGRVRYTETLTFGATTTSDRFTVEFTTTHGGAEPEATPGIVHIVVTEQPGDNEAATIAVRMDGTPLPLVARVNGRRSVTARMSFDDFVRLTRAGTLIHEALDAELELSPLQMGMLRHTADRWAERIRR